MSIIEKTIDFNQLTKPWFHPIPKQCGYDQLQFEYSKETYQNKQIEKNIHFIWIGSLVKEKYVRTLLECKRINTDYTIFFWIDHHTLNDDITILLKTHGIVIKQIEMQDYILRQYNKFDNYGYKADILRLQIVYEYGGIYTDIDSVWLKPFDENFHYDFITYRIDHECKAIGNPLFGFSKKSIILADVIRNLEKSIDCIMKIRDFSTIRNHIPIMTGGDLFCKVLMDNQYDSFHYIHQKWCVIGGPHENIYSDYSKTGKSYCYQTFDNNWSR
jgi:mannosyltransferase OCH1-like enzyme